MRNVERFFGVCVAGLAIMVLAVSGCGDSTATGAGGTGGTGPGGSGGGFENPCEDEFENGLGAYGQDMCYLVGCEDGFADCDEDDATGCEISTVDDRTNCGACGLLCGLVSDCSDGVCMDGPAPATWKVTMVGSDNCTANPRHEGHTGDDHGGIATTPAMFFYVGDDFTGGFDAVTAEATNTGDIYDGIFSDLANGRLYNFTFDGDHIIDDSCDLTFDGYQEIDPLTLMPTGAIMDLDTEIDACAGSATPGIFSGMGMVLVNDGTNTFEVALSDGSVTDLGSGANTTGANTCENWAIWGWAERFDGETYMVFREDNGNDAIVRRAVSDGSTEILLDLGALEDDTGGDASDICSIGLNPANNTWVYHGEDVEGMLGVDPSLSDTEEVVGVCPATIEAPAVPAP